MKLDEFQRYLAELRSLPQEVPLEPELKPQRAKLDKRIREEQALASGAVLTAVLEAGEGGPSPKEGDLVYIHYSIRDCEDDLLYTTRSDEGGPGQAFAFLLERGVRVPRGWELAIRDMTRGQRSVVQLKPGFGFRHPDCAMKPPVRGLPLDKPLRFDITLLHWYDAAGVHHYGSSTAPMYKRCLRDATSWESPRPPFEVTLHLTVCCPAYNGVQLTGQRLFSTRGRQPLTLQLGRGLLPPAVEEALSYMSRDEEATFVVPAAGMRPDGGGGGRRGAAPGGDDGDGSSDEEEDDLLGPDEDDDEGRKRSHGTASTSGRAEGLGEGAGCLVPPPPARCTQLELQVELLAMVQVRDMTGTGEVTKKRLREGAGEFPVDCPINDTTLRLHYRVRPLRRPTGEGPSVHQHQHDPKEKEEAAVAPRAPGAADGSSGAGDGGSGGTGASAGGGGGGEELQGEEAWAYDSRVARRGEPLTVDTGCGELPEGLEMALKLMLPGEVSRVEAAPRFAYAGRDDAPPGVSPAESCWVEFEAELVDFEKEGHWQNLSFEERYVLAERLKAKGNELFRRQQHKYAKARYERLLRMLESTRDYETQEHVERIDGYKVAVLGNLALCCVQLGEHVAAVAACDKALEYEPENAKLLFRKGKALSLNGDHEAAAEVLKLALEYDKSSERDINAELAANAERQKAALRKQKRDLGNFLKPKKGK